MQERIFYKGPFLNKWLIQARYNHNAVIFNRTFEARLRQFLSRHNPDKESVWKCMIA